MTRPAKVGAQTFAPSVKIQEAPLTTDQVRASLGITKEQEDYLKLWGQVPEYRKFSPGEHVASMFIEAAGDDLKATDKLIDWGCGTGRGGYKIHQLRGLDVTFVDFALNALDKDIEESLGDRLRFVEHDITKPTHLRAEWGFCVDVMEHLRPEQVDDALGTIFESCRNVFFSIATGPDHFGQHPEIQHPLHLTQKGYDWWLKKFSNHGVVVHRSAVREGSVVFYTSGYDGFLLDNFRVNTDTETLVENARQNIKLNIQQIQRYPAQDSDTILLGGGPSLNDFEDEIIRKRAQGAKLITTNASYNWAIERGMKPSAALILDARPFNARFIRPVIDDCKYIVSPCCSPETLDGLPLDRTFFWCPHLDPEVTELLTEKYGQVHEGWQPIAGGSTVMLRGLYLLKLLGLGVKNPVDVYGFDSCIMGAHHAYEQKENDGQDEIKLTFNRDKENERIFMCQPWMVAQAKEFDMLHKTVLRDMDIRVHGDGLIAYLLQTHQEIED